MNQPIHIRVAVDRVMDSLRERQERIAREQGGCPSVLVRDEALRELLADITASEQPLDEYADKINGRS